MREGAFCPSCALPNNLRATAQSLSAISFFLEKGGTFFYFFFAALKNSSGRDVIRSQEEFLRLTARPAAVCVCVCVCVRVCVSVRACV